MAVVPISPFISEAVRADGTPVDADGAKRVFAEIRAVSVGEIIQIVQIVQRVAEVHAVAVRRFRAAALF